jgi:hypothetical protein
MKTYKLTCPNGKSVTCPAETASHAVSAVLANWTSKPYGPRRYHLTHWSGASIFILVEKEEETFE